MALWKQSLGTTQSWKVPIVDSTDAAIAYTGSEALSGSLWPGGQQQQSVALVPTWSTTDAKGNPVTPASGLTDLTITETQITSLVPAIYWVRLVVTSGGFDAEYYRGRIQILADAGTETDPPSYCTVDDLRLYAPWIEDVQTFSDQSGFARERGQARKWLDEIIIGMWKYPNYQWQLGMPGFMPSAMALAGRDPIPSKWLRDQLANDAIETNGVWSGTGLMVRESTIELTAKRALYYICASQLGKSGSHSYQDLARRFERESSAMLLTYRAEIYPTTNGYAGIMVNCGATNVR